MRPLIAHARTPLQDPCVHLQRPEPESPVYRGAYRSASTSRRYITKTKAGTFTHACSSTVPSKVKNIHVSNSGDSTSLKVSWTPGQGDVDAFLVFLFRQTRQLDVRRVLKHQNEVWFGSLQPGQMYGVTVQSVSGELLNNNTASGRTGE